MFPLYPKSWQRAAVVVTFGAILAVGLCAWPYTVDDAFIVARYAARLAGGRGYTFNPGPPTDGVTGPLWLVPGWLASLARADPVWAAKATGLVCTALACAVLVRRLLQRAHGMRYAWIAAGLLACQATLGGWAVAGLETGAATLVLTTAVLALTARPVVARWTLGAALGVLPWLRPELLGAGCVLAIGAGLRLGWGRARLVLALAGLGLGALLSFRYFTFGSVVPLAFHAKQASLAHGVDYTLRGACIAFGLLGLPLLWRGARRGRWDDRLSGWLVVAHSVAIALAGGDWMPGFRLFAPVLPVAFGVIAVGAARPARGATRHVTRGLAALTAALLALDLATRIPEWRAAGASRDGQGAALATILKESAKRVALVDVGFLAYASGVEVVDLGGITDPEIARMPGGHLDKAVSDAWLAQRSPDALILHSSSPPLSAADGQLLSLAGYPVERRVASGAWVRREFRVALQLTYAPGYHYVLLVRRSGFGRSLARVIEPRRHSVARFAPCLQN